VIITIRMNYNNIENTNVNKNSNCKLQNENDNYYNNRQQYKSILQSNDNKIMTLQVKVDQQLNNDYLKLKNSRKIKTHTFKK